MADSVVDPSNNLLQVSLAQSSLSFSSLPYEIRRRIYSYIVSYNILIFLVDPKDFHQDAINSLSILCSNRAISEELLDILYTSNLFVVNITRNTHEKLAGFGEQNLRRIQRLCITTSSKPGSGYSGRVDHFKTAPKFDTALWRPLLQNITNFTLVLKEPIAARNRDHVTVIGGDHLAPWAEGKYEYQTYLEALLGFLGEELREVSTLMSIDFNRQKETEKLVCQYLKGRYCFVDTQIGDFGFLRKRDNPFNFHWACDVAHQGRKDWAVGLPGHPWLDGVR